jgi:hypothetical protein
MLDSSKGKDIPTFVQLIIGSMAIDQSASLSLGPIITLKITSDANKAL